MTIEIDWNNQKLMNSNKFNDRGEVIAFALGDCGEIILDENEALMIINDLKYLGKGEQTVKSLWIVLENQGYRLCLDSDKIDSLFDSVNKKIVLGTKDISLARCRLNLSEDIPEKMVFGEILHHEMCHYIVYIKSQIEFKRNLLIKLQNMIINFGGKKITKLAQNYEYPDYIKEDVVELIRLYTISPEVLKKYLKGLQEIFSNQIMQQYNLARIDENQAQQIFDIISQFVS